MDYGKVGVAVGCVLLLVWGVEVWLNRIVTAINGVAAELRATRLQVDAHRKADIERAEWARIRQDNAKAREPKWPTVLDDTNLATPARELIDKMSAKTHAATGLSQKALEKP